MERWPTRRMEAVFKDARLAAFGQVAVALDAGFPVNVKGGNDAGTVLHWAARRGHLPTLARLLAAGADVNTRNAAGWTPVHCAADGGYPEALVALVEAGADVNAASLRGLTPLFLAMNSLPTLRCLLALPHVDLTAVSASGEDAQQYARRDGRLEAAVVLQVEVGALRWWWWWWHPRTRTHRGH
jgi:hypothetical protein